MSRKRFILSVVGLMFFSVLVAQDWSSPEFESMIRTYIKQWYSVTGRVYGVDEYEPNPYPLQGANIKVTCMGDTTDFSGMAADKEGNFWVDITRRDRLKDTRLHIVISYLGMQTLDSIFEPVHKKEDGINSYYVELDSIVLRSNPLTTEEVEIVAELQRMYQRGDTIIFNADAYEMPTGSVLLDLVRRLPGLKYEDGKMTYLGRDIEEIRLNGDSFFKRDMSIALNNMPTDKLKSLKVYEVPDDTLSRMSDNHLIMDMETKEPMDRTIFASIAAGTTDRFDRYSISLDASTWKQGGGEVYGSFSHSTIPSDYSYTLKSENTNGSIYVDKQFEKVTVDGSASYGSNYTENKNSSYNRMFMPEFTQNSVRESESSNGSHNLNGSASAYWRISEKSWTNVNVNYSRTGSHSSNGSIDSISNEGVGLVSFTKQSNRTESDGDSYGVSWGYGNRFGKNDAYSFYSDINFNGSDNESVSYNESESHFYKLNDSTLINHRILSPSNSKSFNGSLSLDRNIGDKGYIGVGYSFSYDGSKSVQNYEDIAADGTLSSVDSLHYDNRNSNINNTFNLNYYYNDSLYRISMSANVSPTVMIIDNDHEGNNEYIRYSGVRYRVGGDFRFRVFRKSSIGFSYTGNNGLPDVSQLSTVTDYRDPMNIHTGNDSLKNSFSHSVSAEFQFRSYMRTRVTYNTTLNQITTLTRLDRETGARRTSPANINGNWGMSEYLFLTYPLHDLSLSFTANHSFRHNVAYVQKYNADSDLKKSATDWNQLSLSLSSGYSDRYWMVSTDVGYSIEKSKSDYLDQSNGGRRFTASGEVSYQTSFGLGASTTCRFNKPFGYEMAEANRAECLWNISAQYSFLKSRQAEVRVTWRDILKQYNGFSANVSGTSWNESRTYGDTSMFVITFSYRFNSFK